MERNRQRKRGGARKIGRSKAKCGIYRTLCKRERSHIRRIEKHMKRYKDNSSTAKNALQKYRDLTNAL